LTNLSHEVTWGTIAGQIKALSMIVAIEPNPSLADPFTVPEGRMRVPDVIGSVFEAVPDTRGPFSTKRGPFRRRR
jgi:hypothetical protein